MDISDLVNVEMCEQNAEDGGNCFDTPMGLNANQMDLDVAVVNRNPENLSCHNNPEPDNPVLFGIGDVYSISPLDPHTTKPPYDLFWSEDQISRTPVLSPAVLVPPPPTNPPEGSGFVYPNAPSYMLVQDSRYQRGYTYVANFDTAKKSMVLETLLHTITPPDIGPSLVEGKLVHVPVPGMILMPIGIPFVNRINGSDKHIITVACIQTVSSMQQYACGLEVSRLADEVLEIAFGKPAVDGWPAIPAIYDLGLKHNDRSTRDIGDPRNGSSSLATTKIEGDGRGVIAPAVQVQHPQISRLLRICYQLFRHIMPTCISKLEWDMFEWIFWDNNVPGFGGPLPNNTGLQVNVSSDIGDLASMIGQFQGRLHTDRNDFHPGFTLFILAIRLPPGSDSGPFFFPRPALYFRAINVALFFAVFKGQDLHSGEKPTVNPDPVVAKEWLAQTGLGQLADLVSMQNRVGMVLYPNHAAFTRITPFLVTPVTGFGNMGSQSHFSRGYPTFANDGLQIFGDVATHKNFLARDLVCNSWNTTILAGIESPVHPSIMLSSMTYTDENGKICRMAPLPYDPVKDRSLVRQMRGHYSWYVHKICDPHHIPITKTAYGSTQQHLRESYKNSLESSRPRLAPLNVRLPIKPRLAVTPDRDPVSAHSTLSTPLSSPPASVIDINSEKPIAAVAANVRQSGSKRKALSPVTEQLDDSHLPEADGSVEIENDDDSEYEIESIQEVAIIDGIPQWRLRFKGYGPSEDLWYEHKGIAKSARCLLKEFHRNPQNNVRPLHELVSSAESDDNSNNSDEDWVDDQDPKPKNTSSAHSQPSIITDPSTQQPSASVTAGMPIMPVVSQFPGPVPDTSFKMLDILLDVARLQEEAIALDAGRNLVGKPMDSDTIVKLLRDRLDLDNQVTAFMELAPESKYTDMSPNDEATLILEQIVGSVDILPALMVESEKLHFLQRAIQWQMCRSYLVFFQWYEDIGPHLARQVANSHRAHTINATFPSFANCVNHVVQYVTCVRTRQQSIVNDGTKRRKTSAKTSNLPTPHPEFNEDFTRLSLIPSHLVDNRIKSSPSAVTPLPIVNRTINNGDAALYAVVSEVLFALWCDVLIIPSLDTADNLFNTSRRRKIPNNSKTTRNKNVVDRSIVRGGMVMALVDIVGEGILASDGIRNFLSSPARMFTKNLQKDDAFASKLIRDYASTMEPLIAHVGDLLVAKPKITEWCDYIGKLVGGALVDLGDRTLSALPGGATKGSRTKKKCVPRSPLKPALPINKLEDILTDSKAPHFGALALICREALSVDRGKGIQDLHLNRVLLGQTKPKYQRTHTLSQTYPFRHTSPYAILFAKHLPARQLTGRLGLANALVFMVSSQCEDTVKFLNSVTFWSDSLEECIDTFDQIIKKNSHFYTDLHYNPIVLPTSSKTKTSKAGNTKKKTGFRALDRREQAALGYIHFDSPTIWGQPSSQLSLFSEIPHRDPLVNRFTELFSDDFQTRWTNFLGPLFNQDPAAFTGNIPTWNDMHQFICKLTVAGLGSTTQSSLTAFQLTNNLTLARLCTPPLVEDVTAWIWKMKKAGAYRGLQELGFDVTSLHRTHISFKCVFKHFDDNLSQHDRSSMGFDIGCGVIFVEHILCKVVRWDKRLVFNCGQGASLVELGDVAAEAKVTWTKGANYDDASLFPIPLKMSQDHLTEVLIDAS